MPVRLSSCSCFKRTKQFPQHIPSMEISFAIRPLRSFHAYSPLQFLLYRSYNSLSSSSLASSRARRIPIVAARSLSDDASTVGLATQPVEANSFPVKVDPIFEVQKKAIEVVNDLKGTSIFLVGMNSAMKAKIGKVIAEALRYYYFDSEGLVEEAAGDDSSGKSFRERDGQGFRESETEVLRQLSSMGRLIVNAGNGAVQTATNLSFLRHGISIWIDVPLDIIATECTEDSNHKSSSEILGELAAVYQENRGGYATADACISLQKVASNLAYDEFEQVTAEDMALEVLTEIEKLTRVKKMMEQAGQPF